MRSMGPFPAGIWAILSCLLLVQIAGAQTIITYSDVRAACANGQLCVGYSTPANQPVTVKIGKPSMSAQTWDFSLLPFEQTSNIEFVDPGEAPYSTLFTKANVVRRATVRSIPEAYYQYLELAAVSFSLLGYYAEGDTSAFVYSPSVRQLKLPCAFGSSWNHTADPVHPAPGVTVVTQRYFVVDAQGTIKLRQGTYPALRIRCETETDIQTAAGNSILRTYQFNFLTPDMISVTLSIDSTQTALTEVDVTGVGLEIPSSPVRVEQSGDRPFGGSALELSPSPVRSGQPALIRFLVPRPGPVEVVVYDILGKEAAHLSVPEAQAGENRIPFPANGLPSGFYMCAIRSGDTRILGRAIVLK